MAIKREIAEKMMGEKGTLLSSSFSVIPDGYLGLVDCTDGRRLAVVCSEKSKTNNAWNGAEFEPAAENKKIKMGLFPLNPNNAALVRRLVSWAAPSSCGVNGISVAFSEWLGIVNSQLPNLFTHKQIKPVLVILPLNTVTC